jgi:hypothetical protein
VSNQSLPFAAACERNKQPILQVLQRVLLNWAPPSGLVLEIGSGTGQHVVHFSAHLPQFLWQPSERPEHLAGLQHRLSAEAGANVLPAIELDVAGIWPELLCQAVISANTAHIMSWPEVVSMFDGIARVLESQGAFSLYGPFNENGQFTSPSNQQFDQDLRSRAAHMGLRDVAELEMLANERHMMLEEIVSMPANNRILVFRKQE